MIQRIQTILLFLAAALNVSVFFGKLADASSTETMESPTLDFYGTHLQLSHVNEATMQFETSNLPLTQEPTMLVHVIALGLSSLVLLVSIFLYSNRGRQIKVVYAGIVLLMAQIAMAALLFNKMPEMIHSVPNDPHQLGIFFFFPAGSVLLALWAVRRIQHDEKLVKGMDRLR
jgi:hypothetical protein